MGLEIRIELHVQISESSGLPSVWVVNEENLFTLVQFDPAVYIVPPEFRKFINQKGKFFNAYIETFMLEDSTPEVDCSAFLTYFPTWEDVQNSSEYEGCESHWTEKDHNEFKQAMEWFESKGSFYVTWSY